MMHEGRDREEISLCVIRISDVAAKGCYCLFVKATDNDSEAIRLHVRHQVRHNCDCA